MSTIVICYDGTGNQFTVNRSNVLRMFEILPEEMASRRFYDPGVGTVGLLGNRGDEILGKAFGFGLEQNIQEGYRYLMNNYNAGDQLFLFGFSRGAFTARALAGMLHRFGLLYRSMDNLLPYLSRMYHRQEFVFADDFSKSFCRACVPHFIGIWDSVASLGYLHGKTFFDQTLNPEIKNGYHALAIDEHRKKFPVTIWDEKNVSPGQNIQQVWFAGCHSDVGGLISGAGTF